VHLQKFAFLLSTPLIVMAAGPKSGPPYEVSAPLLVQRYELISGPGQFTFDAIKSRSRADLDRVHKRANGAPLHFVRISYFADRDDLERTVAGKAVDQVTYDLWKKLYELHGYPPLPMADLIEINNEAVLRFFPGGKDGNTRLTPLMAATGRGTPGGQLREATEGSPPLLSVPQLEIHHGGTFKLLELMVEPDGSLQCYVELVSTPEHPAISESDARTVATIVAKTIGIKDVRVYLRADTWFILQPEFPIAYRFESSTPPAKHTFEREKTLIGDADFSYTPHGAKQVK
jgi:hypothetical protein